MITFDESSKLRGFQIFEEQQLREVRELGWQLVALVQEKSFEPHCHSRECPGGSNERPCPHGSYSSGCYSTINIETPMEVTRTKYLMARSRDDVLADAGTTIEELKAQIEETNMTLADEVSARIAADKAQKRLSDELDQEASRRTRLTEKVDDLEKRVRNHLETINKMEADLGKVRKHWGDAAVNELLSPAKEKEDSTQ